MHAKLFVHMGNCLHVKEQTCTLLIITWFGSRNCTKLPLHLTAKKGLFPSCALHLSFRLHFFSVHYEYAPFLYNMLSIYIAALPFLINWSEKQCCKSNILTMDHKLVLKISVQLLLTHCWITLSVLKTIKYLNIRLRQI